MDFDFTTELGTIAYSEKLPPELMALIFDFLQPDLQTLAKCGLVCKAWLPVSRCHIFRMVTLSATYSSPIPPATLELFESPVATIPPYVRRLTLDLKYDPSTTFNGIMPYLVPFTSVQSLWLRDMDWAKVSTTSASSAVSTFSGIRELGISRVAFMTIAQLVDLICSFPQLERLDLDSIFLSQSGMMDPTPIEGHISPHLRSLCYKSARTARETMFPVVDWLSLHDPPPPIHNLHLIPVSAKELPVVKSFIHAIRSTLQELTISFGSTVTPGQYLHGYDA